MLNKVIQKVVNVNNTNNDGLHSYTISNSKIVKIEKQSSVLVAGDYELDGKQGIILSPYVEPHIHLDTTLTAGQPRWNKSGTLFEGIECWSERKQLLTINDVKERALKTLKMQASQGIQFVRTHVDVSDDRLLALKAMLEVKTEVSSLIDLQIVAFPQEGILSYKNGEELLEEALVLGADGVGGIPHFEFTREYGVASLHKVFDLAQKYNKFIDVHCDEIDDEQSRFLETLATLAYERELGSKVTASHTTAMHSYNNAYTFKLFRLLKLSNINFVANPLVNTHLQGRFDSYPKRRGITRVKELLEAGLNVCFGHDDIADPWYPLGNANMLQVLHMGLHVCQLMGYDEICQSLNLITTNSAKTLNLANYGLEVGSDANFNIVKATSPFNVIKDLSPIVYGLRGGKVILYNKISDTELANF